MKRFIVAFIAAYVFMFAWGWLLNGVLLKDVYAETPNLWRSQSEMMSLFHWIIIGQALLIFAFVAIYASGFAGGGVMAGIRLGILLEIAAIGMRTAITILRLDVERWTLNVGVRGKTFANSSSPWLSHASGMGTACRDVAFMAAARRDQFPGFIRSNHAGLASNGRGADRIRTSLH